MLWRAAEMGWSESYFWSALFCEYTFAWNGYTRRIERESWDSARHIIEIIYNTNVKKGKQKNAKKLVPLGIDPQIRIKTDEEIRQMFAMIPDNWKTKN